MALSLSNLYGCDEPGEFDPSGLGERDRDSAGLDREDDEDRGGDEEILPEVEGDEDGPRRSGVPDALVGEWKFGIISFTNFWGSQGQYVGNGGGTSVFFAFTADGRFKQQVYLSRRNYSCLAETWTEVTGTVSFAGDRFTIHPASGRYKASDACVQRNNFDRAMTAEERRNYVKTHVFKFETNPNDGKEYLMIGWEDSDSWSHFRPASED